MSYLLRVTITDETAKRLADAGKAEDRKESNMTEVLLKEALASSRREGEAMIAGEGFIEFGSNEDWFPEDRVTVALRAAPKPRVLPFDESEMRRALTRSIESGNLSAASVELAKKMRGDYL